MPRTRCLASTKCATVDNDLHFIDSEALGCHWYDFYGIAPSGRPDHKWADISVFKRKFGGHELSFVPALDFIYDAECYEAYRQSKSRKKQ